MTPSHRTLLVAALAVATPLAAQRTTTTAQPTTLHLRRVDRPATDPAGKVDKLMSAYNENTPGAAIGVLRGGKLVFAKGYGRASLEYPSPIGPRTVFHVASVSKQFTAFAVILLARDGKLGLDDDVRKYIPELPDLGTTITLRHLLNHTSGIRDQWDLWGMSGGRMDDVITQDDLFRLVTRQRALNFKPGAEQLYSNSGYMLLAKVVERVSGKPFPVFLRERVFTPLGMRDTRVHMDHQEIVPGRAYSYEPNYVGGYRNSVLSYANAGATSLFTTVEDLARWLENFHTSAVGGVAARDMQLTRGILTKGDTIDYALGVSVDRYRGQRRISHGGADAGFRSYVAFFPEIDAGVIALSNDASFNATGVALQVADLFLGDALGPAPATDKPAVAANSASAPITIGATRLAPLLGEFAAGGFSVVTTQEQGKLFATARGQSRALLQPTSDSTFVVQTVGATLTFLRRAAGVDTVRLVLNGNTMMLVRQAPYVWTPAAMRGIAGRYYSPELDVAYDLVTDSATLIVRRRHNADLNLRATGRDTFGGTWPIATLRVERDASGRATALLVSSSRVRDVRFLRQDSIPALANGATR